MLLVDALDMLGERAVVRFKLEGMSSSTTDEPKRKEAKAARLE